MKKITLLTTIILAFLMQVGYAQSVGINSDGSTPDPSAMLDVKSNSKGFLPPRIALTGTTDESTISSPVAGLLIYNTSNTNDVTPGYYYYGGSSWIKVDAGLWSFDLEEDISTSYNVGIGTTSPSYKLDISSDDNYGMRIGPNTLGRSLLLGGWNDTDFSEASIQASNGNLHLDAKGVNGGPGDGIYMNHYHNGDVYLVAGGGNVGIGLFETSPSYKLHVNGSVAGVGPYVNASDARLKKDVVNINDGLSKVMQLRPVTFNWKQEDYPDINLDDRNHVGFIAQEVEEVVPQVVSTAGDEMQTKSIAYSDLVPVLTKAIQEQQAEIEALKAQNAMLTGKVTELDQLKAEVENLKKSLGLGTQLTDNK